jgi:hypothetical protein
MTGSRVPAVYIPVLAIDGGRFHLFSRVRNVFEDCRYGLSGLFLSRCLKSDILHANEIVAIFVYEYSNIKERS